MVSSTPPRVIAVNLDKAVLPSTQRQISMSFNRDMDRASVEDYFSIQPEIKGKFSWSGHTVVFSPEEILPYNTSFQLRIGKEAQDINRVPLAQDYHFDFQTVPLQFAYIGVEGNEQNKLILSSFDGSKREALTDGTIHIEHFQFCPENTCVYFLGYKESVYQNQINELYYLNLKSRDLKQITSDRNFLNKSFQLSPNGQNIILSRIRVSPDGQYLTQVQLWVASTETHNFTLFHEGRATGTDFFLSPDSSTILYLNKDDNFEIASLYPKSKEEPQFIGSFSRCYGFHPYQPLIAFTKEKTDGFFVLTNDLNLYLGDGTIQPIPHDGGLFRDTVFSPDGKNLITIFSKKTENFNEKDSLYPLRIFHLYSYNFKKKELTQLTSNFDYSEENPVVSPDSRYLLFQRYETFSKDLVLDPDFRDVAESLGNVMSGGQIWAMNLQTHEMKQLPMKGTKLKFLN